VKDMSSTSDGVTPEGAAAVIASAGVFERRGHTLGTVIGVSLSFSW